VVTLLERFELMVRMRRFEEECLIGLEAGDIHGELHLSVGQEAVAAAMAGVLRDDDAVVSTHRNHLHAIAKGVPLEPLLAEIFERETGLCGGFGGHMHPFDPAHNFHASGIVGSSVPAALGYAYGHRLRGSDGIAVACLGDGAVNTGQFHEAMSMAGAWKLPLLALVENNEFAISVPVDSVSPTRTVAERATAYGAAGRRVDGTDLEAMAGAFAEAVAHVRGGNGPYLLEALCARLRGHFEGDTDHYRAKADLERWRQERDPLISARRVLLERGEASDAELDELIDRVAEEMTALRERVQATAFPPAERALDHVFAEART